MTDMDKGIIMPNGEVTVVRVPHIYQAVVEVMEKIGAIGKNKTANMGSRGSYNFRGIDDIYNALQRPMIEAKIFAKPSQVLDLRREDKVTDKGITKYTVMTCKYTFCSAVDGSEISVETIGEAMDTGDKSCNKAMSAAFKYACFQLFCIPTEEMLDSEQDTYVMQQPKRQPTQIERRQPQPDSVVITAYDYVPFSDGDPAVAGKSLKDLYKTNSELIDQLRSAGDEITKTYIAAIDKFVAEYKAWKRGE